LARLRRPGAEHEADAGLVQAQRAVAALFPLRAALEPNGVRLLVLPALVVVVPRLFVLRDAGLHALRRPLRPSGLCGRVGLRRTAVLFLPLLLLVLVGLGPARRLRPRVLDLLAPVQRQHDGHVAMSDDVADAPGLQAAGDVEPDPELVPETQPALDVVGLVRLAQEMALAGEDV